jgi:hypothetical protein
MSGYPLRRTDTNGLMLSVLLLLLLLLLNLHGILQRIPLSHLLFHH